VLSPTRAGRIPVSSHHEGAQSRRFAAGPGFPGIEGSTYLRGVDL